MGTRFYRPIEALRDIVGRLYVHASDVAEAADRRWLIVPDGDIKLIFPITGDIRCRIGDRERVHPGGRLIVSGMRTVPGELSFPSGIDAIGVILRAESACRLLAVPHGEIRNRTFDGEQIFGSAALRLQQELGGIAGDDARVAVFQSRLADWLAPGIDPIFESAVRWLRQSGGRRQVNSVAAELGCSERQLERKFLMPPEWARKSWPTSFDSRWTTSACAARGTDSTPKPSRATSTSPTFSRRSGGTPA